MAFETAQAGIRVAYGKVSDMNLPYKQKHDKATVLRALTQTLTDVEDTASRIDKQAESIISEVQKLGGILTHGQQRAIIAMAQDIRKDAYVHGQKRK